jgi:hypothetical protein
VFSTFVAPVAHFLMSPATPSVAGLNKVLRFRSPKNKIKNVVGAERARALGAIESVLRVRAIEGRQAAGRRQLGSGLAAQVLSRENLPKM